MAKKFDIAAYAAQLPTEEGPRDIEAVTAEILRLKEDAGNAIIGIGQRLIEAKGMLSHGEWLPWLTERVEFSERTAQNLMRLSREWSNPQTLADLGASKALTLLALPPEEREQFMAEAHVVDGEEKTVIDMSARELDKAIRERDEALKAAEAAKAEAKSAEDSRAKMEADMAAMKRLQEGAAAELDTRSRELEQARSELKALQDKPVDVAVMAVDQEALERAKREAVAELQAKVDKAVEARKKAEEQRKAAEAALQEAKTQAEARLEEARRQLEAAAKAEKHAALAGDKDLATFDVLFSQVQEQINRIHGLLLKTEGRGDVELAAKLRKALLALAENVRGCAE